MCNILLRFTQLSFITVLGLPGLRVFLGIMGKFYVSVAFDALYTWSTELYPTVIR